MTTKAKLYFEAHITVDQKADEFWTEFVNIYPSYFRHSKFDVDDVDNYHGKWFMSARSEELESMKELIKNAIDILNTFGYNVVRWKIEDTLLDSKYGDILD